LSDEPCPLYTIVTDSITLTNECNMDIRWALDVPRSSYFLLDFDSANGILSTTKKVVILTVRLTVMFPATVNELMELKINDNFIVYLGVKIKTQSFLANSRVIDMKQLIKDKKIGAGAYSSVYKGSYMGVNVAIKDMMASYMLSGEDFLNYFKKEVVILSNVHHKNIVSFIGACTEPPNLLIVMEFADRGNLYDIIHNRELSISEDLAISLGTQIADGLTYLHQHKIVHRDLKSPNILVTIDWVAQIADFGTSRVVDQVMTLGIGTRQWMAPEVLCQLEYTEKSDVYSYAVILWELFARIEPFTDLPKFNMPNLVANGHRPQIPHNCPDFIAKIISLGWSTNPNLRPAFPEVMKMFNDNNKLWK